MSAEEVSVIQEVFLALIGFTGSLISEYSDDEFRYDKGIRSQVVSLVIALHKSIVGTTRTFGVRDGVSLLSDAERQQINLIVPLGWYYLNLSEYHKKYDICWGSASNLSQSKVININSSRY